MRTIVHQFAPALQTVSYSLPLYIEPVKAGFPSPADDFIDTTLNLHEHVVKHPSSTFFVRVNGNSMHYSGIHSGDMLVVDRSLLSQQGSIVVVISEGEFMVKEFNSSFPQQDVQIWGVVTYIIHKT